MCSPEGHRKDGPRHIVDVRCTGREAGERALGRNEASENVAHRNLSISVGEVIRAGCVESVLY